MQRSRRLAAGDFTVVAPHSQAEIAWVSPWAIVVRPHKRVVVSTAAATRCRQLVSSAQPRIVLVAAVTRILPAC